MEAVGDEIQGIADELSDWVDDRDAGFFLEPDPAMLRKERARFVLGRAG